MKVYKGYRLVERAPERAVVAIGNFDGVHLGHRKIVDMAIGQARARGGTAVVYTFRPHPQLVLRAVPDGQHQLLSTYDEKLALLAALGADWTVEEPFSREFATTSPESFFSEILRGRLAAEAIVVGYDFGFGQGRAGGIEALREFSADAGVGLSILPPFKAPAPAAPGGDAAGASTVDAEVVSSSRIRRALLDGDLAMSNRLLGREFSYRGPVEHGAARGAKIGFPTVNLRPDKLVLPYGVYATWLGAGGRRYASVTNVGVRPTVAETGAPVLVETHVIGESLDLYDQEVEVSFVKRLRGEQRFASLDELRAQIARDVGEASAELESL